MYPYFALLLKKAFKTRQSLTKSGSTYVVRTLATVLMSYVDHLRMSDCAIVTKALIAKFPFLADTVGKPHVSVITNNFHAYNYFIHTIVFLDEICDEVSYNRNMSRMVAKLEKSKPNLEILIDLMKQTFPNRRAWIIGEEKHVSTICEKFPLLKSP